MIFLISGFLILYKMLAITGVSSVCVNVVWSNESL
jgi:hypothetical protein